MASLVTLPDDPDEDTILQTQFLADLVSKGRLCLKNMKIAINNKKAPSAKLVSSLRNILDTVEKRDKLTQENITNLNTDIAVLQEKCSHQEETISHLKEDNNRLLSSIPTVDHITAALKDALTEQAIKASLLAMTEPVVAPTPAPTYRQAAASPPLIDPDIKRTIVVKGRSITHGKNIESMLAQANMAVTFKINRVVPKRNHVEITCGTEEDAHQLQRELQRHNTLNKNLCFLKKAPQWQKMILQGVPSSTGATSGDTFLRFWAGAGRRSNSA